ncbi:hypothetical protein B7435_09675 [Mycolicibacterium peregrinum]|uniref:Uncharacterized protein n=1 Tax=Mycolicibacterium peregrinum TaxID=43304 RepID=A0A1X2AFZ4_MYCPR|nr:hypothetical protein [Mycolicibacterium peregrinum]MCV7204753.1 hypothetical protein [Mycolicibacterium peregrinum]ORW50253.1 hypothetical protein AWC21_33530 [Mycolicibacterium peregrinum]OWM05190.1 hypothetical protein B7435_09675 [Mycolicibacterium peregrinum]TGB38768.1 hypothetical protein EJD94_22995 [Mycolicibacterium peregrinum]TGB42131.1 hypothetical protein EJD98_15255 [Mycolicibacterium peregrinum]
MTYQADHTLLLALPAFAPAVVVVGVVVYVAMRDRRRGEDNDANQDDVRDEGMDSSGEDGSP